MKNMNLNGTGFEKAQAYIEEYMAAYNDTMSQKENKINYIQKQFPEKSRAEVIEIVDALYEGCAEYKKKLEEALSDKKFSIKEAFSNRLSDCSTDEKYTIATNLLLAVQAIDNNVIAENADDEHLDVKAKIEELLSKKVETTPGMVNQEDLEALLDELDNAINSTAFGFYGCEQMIKLVEDDEDNTVSFVQDYWENEELKATTAMGAYVAYLKGELPSGEGEVSAQEMAVLISAEIDKDATIKRASAGQIVWEKAMHILQIIGAVAVGCLIFYAIWKLVEMSMLFGAAVFSLAFGGGVIAGLIGAFFGAVFIWNICSWIGDHADEAAEKVGKVVTVAKEKIKVVYEKTRDYTKNVVVPKVKTAAKKTWEFIDKRIIGGVVRAWRALKNTDGVVVS